MAKQFNGTMKCLSKDRLDITQNQANQLIAEEMALRDFTSGTKKLKKILVKYYI
ncbi:TPA: hypothetical protein OO122_001048 [Legionella pneumophila]|nr:hypothetical protein [Legionella pneumophila]HAT2066644.1 hypothetical protein [Legionella pneumophila]HCR5122610.1 hypothetical protein [Legionella pneumophila]HCR5125485.1 hypothetical protein [Legionella pneumophila]HCR5128474.1 hypothetical protein [Legionella pneumophila]HCR5131538.1 hypothetical protein [Legionella pneumophila]